MRVIIAGSRNFQDYKKLREKCLDIFNLLKSEGYNTKKDNITIISGGAKGADALGEQFAGEFGLNLKIIEANWNDTDVEGAVIKQNKYGKYNAVAGHQRNEEMAIFASESSSLGVLIAFSVNNSSGTANMIQLAEKYKLRSFVENI